MDLNTRQANFLAKVRKVADTARDLYEDCLDIDESWSEEFNGSRDNSLEILEGDTTVNADSAAGQDVLNIVDNTGFRKGDGIIIDKGGNKEEKATIETVGDTSLTLMADLIYTHTAVDTDTVRTMGPLYDLGLTVTSIQRMCNRFGAGFIDFWDNEPVTQREYGRYARRVANNQ